MFDKLKSGIVLSIIAVLFSVNLYADKQITGDTLLPCQTPLKLSQHHRGLGDLCPDGNCDSLEYCATCWLCCDKVLGCHSLEGSIDAAKRCAAGGGYTVYCPCGTISGDDPHTDSECAPCDPDLA